MFPVAHELSAPSNWMTEETMRTQMSVYLSLSSDVCSEPAIRLSVSQLGPAGEVAQKEIRENSCDG